MQAKYAIFRLKSEGKQALGENCAHLTMDIVADITPS